MSAQIFFVGEHFLFLLKIFFFDLKKMLAIFQKYI